MDVPDSWDSDTVDAIPSEGVAICATDFVGIFEHATVCSGGSCYGQSATPGTTSDPATWADTSMVDQTDREAADPSLKCEEVAEVDEDCIMAQLAATGSLENAGTYGIDVPEGGVLPQTNVCWNQVMDAVRACGGDPTAHMPSDGPGDDLANEFYKTLDRSRQASQNVQDVVDTVTDAVDSVIEWATGD